MKHNWKSSRLLRLFLGSVQVISAVILILFASVLVQISDAISGALKNQPVEQSSGFKRYVEADLERLQKYLQEREKRSIEGRDENQPVIYIYNEDRTKEIQITRQEVLAMEEGGIYFYQSGDKYVFGGGNVKKEMTFEEEEGWYAQSPEMGYITSQYGLEDLFYDEIYSWMNRIYAEELSYQSEEEFYMNFTEESSNFRYYVEDKKTGKSVLACGIKDLQDAEGMRYFKNVDTGSYRIAYGVDGMMPAADKYQDYIADYSNAEKWQTFMIALLLTGGLGWLVSLVLLLACTGYKKHKEGIVLTRMDHMRLEGYTFLLVIGVFGLWTVLMVPIGILGSGIGSSSSAVYQVIMNASVMGAVYLGCYWLLFTCVRRFKAHTSLADNFLLLSGARAVLRWLREGFKALYKDRNMSGRVILGFVSYVLASTFLLLLWDSTYSGFMRLILFLLLAALNIGTLALLLRYVGQRRKISEGAEKQAEGDWDHQIDTAGMWAEEKTLAESINQMGAGLQKAIDSATRNERMKTELIVNVSHDIKTPLTSIINYVDLIRRENCENENIRKYIQILDQKSQRLKQLTEDLVEAAKANTGNIELNVERLDMVQLLKQAMGELEDKFAARNLLVVPNLPEEGALILADGRRLWRVFENLLNNICKYAMPGTRVYLDMCRSNGMAAVVMKNISESPLNIPADELTERFTRGDASRSTEGSGLGLSIAKSLTELMGGRLELYLDGDLFRATVEFPEIIRTEEPKVPDGGEKKEETAVVSPWEEE
ncbi:sensor histidine kinase [Cuneatibacter caecimuris]|uniref:histidine kinase n=1 Tax=Cuneatibacter caecimuris TaxID=1796618 RepID=A0A4Q7PMZ2_9FIRM|nr:HAMP domain-containing sensor histidine kinase [Cuneatibacter caecimuris]RZT00413.1 signal transduction histidine kinase [Cuneatibacter caecimuris]